MKEPNTVYFIKPIGMQGPVKIGCSCAPDNRRSTLETWSPFPLEIVAEIPGGRKLERRFQVRHVASSIGREWFDWTPELQADIDAINSGSFDLNCLPEGHVKFPRHRERSLTYITPAFRFRSSICARFRNRVGLNKGYHYEREICAILPASRYYHSPEVYWEHREQLERRLEEICAVLAQRKAA